MEIRKPIVDGEFTHLDDIKNKRSIFLAGPCPRDDWEHDWRLKAFEMLEEIGFDGVVITPTNPDYQSYREHDKDALRKQTEWEYKAMHDAQYVVFWIARDFAIGHPGFTTNIEFGEWFKEENAIIGFPFNAPKNDYIQIRCDMIGKKVFYDLKEMLTDTVNKINTLKTR